MIRHIMAPTRRIDAIGSGKPFDEIYSTVLLKPFILPGMADINIAEINTLEKKSKKVLILLFLVIEFFMNLLYENSLFLEKYLFIFSKLNFDFFKKRVILINKIRLNL